MYSKVFKRIIDFILSFFALVILSPLFILLIIIGALVMKGNPFFVQERPGRNETIFKLIKFRTMTNVKDDQGNLLPDNERNSRYGNFLRKTSLDELGELLNIIKGDMSIIGPRPLLVRYLPYYTENERHRHDVRPGLTGWAQINGRNFITWEEIFSLDVFYVNHLSFTLDLKIIFMTIKKVLFHEDITDATQGTVDSIVILCDKNPNCIGRSLSDSFYEVDAIAKTMVRVRGSYALELMFRDYPGEIWVARKDSPMIIGIADGETYVASDVPAILKYTRQVYYIGNLEFARLTPGEAHFYNLNGEEIEKQTTQIKWDAEAAEKAGFEHFMMKEIHEQPKAIQDTLNSVIKDGAIDFSGLELTKEEILSFEQIYIVACGSAWHVGMAAQYVLEDMARIPVRVELASEFRYRPMALNQNALVIVISQSGETADTLAALRLAKEKGMTTLAIVNVVGSSIAREADKVFYTLAGPEISVATTKAYSAQLAAMYCIAVEFAFVRGKITEEQYAYYISELLTIVPKINKILEDKERLQWFAAKYAGAHDVFFVGRGIDYAVSLEGSLKLKEISYIHSEAYAAGELKHGTISLIEPGTLVIGVLTQSKLYEKTMSNMVECRSRGAYLLGLTTYGKYEIEETVDFAVYVPRIDEYFAGSLAVVPLQLLGYYVSVAKGLDVDKPRNLAKSVTVE